MPSTTHCVCCYGFGGWFNEGGSAFADVLSSKNNIKPGTTGGSCEGSWHHNLYPQTTHTMYCAMAVKGIVMRVAVHAMQQ
jgi:hypothetical protein